MNNKGFTFVGILVGVSLLLIVFLGIYGIFQLNLKVVGQNRARITATTLANQKIEIIKNLAYDEVGTVSGIPSGEVLESETITRNNIDYIVKTTIGYVDDPFDGLAPADLLPNDYKKAKVKVFWTGLLDGEVTLITSIAPKGLETTEGGGNLLISVFDALGQPISQADIHLVNDQISPNIDAHYQTNNQGQYLVAGAPSSTNAYQITVSKDNYSTDRTYSFTEVVNPEKPQATVLEGDLTEISFSIDRLSNFSLRTLSPYGGDSFADSFLNQDKISESSNIIVNQGQITLATTTATTTLEYISPGSLTSEQIEPVDIVNWDKFSWTDTEPAETSIKYQVLYNDGENWVLIPEIDLPGNNSGFDSSPVDLSGLATTTYGQLEIKGNLSTDNTSTTPALFDWAISWITGQPTVINYVAFNLQGNKIIGTDAQEDPIYKYSEDFTTNASGQLDINNLEWDAYDFSIHPAENLDLVNTDPISDPLGQKIDLLPDTDQEVDLFLDAENSLLLSLLDSETSSSIFSGKIRLYNNGLGYDETQFTNESGQTLFIPLTNETYQIEIQADGYEDYSGVISVAGDKTSIIYLTPSGPT